MAEPNVLVERDGFVATVRLNRPAEEKRAPDFRGK
jgi:hypothetical protein